MMKFETGIRTEQHCHSGRQWQLKNQKQVLATESPSPAVQTRQFTADREERDRSENSK
jgi:hypothetical protein